MLPLEASETGRSTIRLSREGTDRRPTHAGPDPDAADRVMLLRPRKSRIYYLRRFFEYPITAQRRHRSQSRHLRGPSKIGLSYLKAALFPLKEERTLEQFFINRFGRELYRTFFKSYTEKVWGVPCDQISAEWGAQRIKGLSIWATFHHALKNCFESGGRIRPEGRPRLR